MYFIYNMTSFVASYVYYFVPILVGILITVAIKRNFEYREAITHDSVIRVPVRNRFHLAGALISFLLYLLILLKVFIPEILNIHSLLVPEHINKWYELLWVDNVSNLIYHFFYVDRIHEATLLIRYNDYLVLFIVSTSLLLISFYLIHQSLQKVLISDNVLYTANAVLNWTDIENAKLVEIKTKNKRRYILQLIILSDITHRNLSGIPLKSVDLYLTLEEKEIIEDLMKTANKQITIYTD